MSIGRWSKESCFRVFPMAELVKWIGRMVKSGEAGCCSCRRFGRGSRVELLSFILNWVESVMMEFIVIPIWSLVGEGHV